MPQFIHFVGATRPDLDLRPVCGAWSESVAWTTVREAMTCPACARLIRVSRPERHDAVRAEPSAVARPLAGQRLAIAR